MANIELLMPMIKQFLPFAQKRMGFQDPPRLFLKGDSKNAKNPLGKTAFYDPENMSVTIYTTDRHPKDIMRSLSHELVHHAQNCRGEFDKPHQMGDGYAQNDSHMREMEREAYEVGNMCFRDWEDGIKQTIYFEHLQKGDNKMSTKDWKNGEIKSLLSEAWGFKMDLSKLNEAKGEKGDANPLDGERAKFDKDHDGVPDGADKDKDDPDVQEEGVMDLMRKAGRRIPKASGAAFRGASETLNRIEDALKTGEVDGARVSDKRLGRVIAGEMDYLAHRDDGPSLADRLHPKLGEMAAKVNDYVINNPEEREEILQMVGQLKATLADYGAGKKMEEGAFDANHYCVHHGGVHHEGKIRMAEAIQHVKPDENGHISHYDMKLEDGTVLENVAVEDIQITNASLAEEHSMAKRDHKDMKDRPEEEELDEQSKTDRPDRVAGRDSGGRRVDEARLRQIIAHVIKTKG